MDGESTKTFQESINDMTSSLPTLQQIKFNEALYILKTFGVEADGDLAELKALPNSVWMEKVRNFAMADKVAKENGIIWQKCTSFFRRNEYLPKHCHRKNNDFKLLSK